MPKTYEHFGGLFQNKRVLVTGNTGFKGSWLSLWLQQLGAEVSGYSIDVPTVPSLFTDELKGLVPTTFANVADPETLTQEILRLQPNFIFHLAAQPIVAKSYEDPLLTWQSNAIGTASVLESIRRSGLSDLNVVMVTSDKVYRNKEWHWGYREDDELGGEDPYSASKAAAELAIRSFVTSQMPVDKNLRIAVVRAGNVIGGGDWSQGRVVPDLVRSWINGEELILRSPFATRPWLHVLEPVGGYLLTAAKLSAGEVGLGEAYNFGPRSETISSVMKLSSAVAGVLGNGARISVSKSPPSFKESSLLSLSSEKARSELGWFPLLSFEETAKWTGSWYSRHRYGESAIELVREQIRDYQGKISKIPLWGVTHEG